MTAADFLVEIGTEELPPRALRELELAFADALRRGLEAAQLTFDTVRSYATPRRLAVLVEQLAAEQPPRQISRRGPPVSAAFDALGAPTRAALAFAASCGVPVESLTRVRDVKGEFLHYCGSQPGAATRSLLPEIVRAALDALPIPRRMRWGAGNAEFVRPVHWIVLLFGTEVVPARLLDTDAGRATHGHRFLAPEALPLGVPRDYAPTLRRAGKVIADFAERREQVRAEIVRAAAMGTPVMSEELLDEVTALVEWPVGLAGRFDERYLQLPREVLIATLQHHQRYFPVEDGNGRLLPWFIAVSNIESRDPARVRAGNERVVRPRLADAEFFYAQDRRQPLAERRGALDQITYQDKLGSIGDKVRRMADLAADIAERLGYDPQSARQAADLAKCDLVTAMVGEFPELQGIIGRYYALADGVPPAIADAIAEHYLPRGAADELPNSPAGIAVALADRLDTLAGIFAIGQKPTGTKDPFGLRRAAIGALRILLEKQLDLDVPAVVGAALHAQPVVNPGAAAELRGFL
ncbi:MAG: glycine--tRNA ligase subunit beta, partial [Steroidobacteraceae bacterium]|nr:glycine--tRNA ligase subunit beta [Steroidobacteraceae bacterium]MDW8258736.1 glycine--tRNA ligase subunit beta [Gammaproteobacteria bacterium]